MCTGVCWIIIWARKRFMRALCDRAMYTRRDRWNWSDDPRTQNCLHAWVVRSGIRDITTYPTDEKWLWAGVGVSTHRRLTSCGCRFGVENHSKNWHFLCPISTMWTSWWLLAYNNRNVRPNILRSWSLIFLCSLSAPSHFYSCCTRPSTICHSVRMVQN